MTRHLTTEVQGEREESRERMRQLGPRCRAKPSTGDSVPGAASPTLRLLPLAAGGGDWPGSGGDGAWELISRREELHLVRRRVPRPKARQVSGGPRSGTGAWPALLGSAGHCSTQPLHPQCLEPPRRCAMAPDGEKSGLGDDYHFRSIYGHGRSSV